VSRASKNFSADCCCWVMQNDPCNREREGVRLSSLWQSLASCDVAATSRPRKAEHESNEQKRSLNHHPVSVVALAQTQALGGVDYPGVIGSGAGGRMPLSDSP
jgi:hypothetical protein